jgi:hypothetical protein
VADRPRLDDNPQAAPVIVSDKFKAPPQNLPHCITALPNLVRNH